MKNWCRAAAVIAALSLLLAGCAPFRDEYVSVSEHNNRYAEKETTVDQTELPEQELPSASTYYEMKSILRNFINSGIEHGQFKLEQYDGVVGRDLDRVTEFYMNEDPVGAYAVDYLSYEKQRVGTYWQVQVDAVYRRSASEIQAIQSTRGNERADALIVSALAQFDSSITLQISGYQEEDFLQTVRNIALQRPDAVTDLPETSVSIYPDSGNVRIVELHFTYPFAKDDMRTRLSEVNSVISSAASYARYSDDARIKLSLIYTFLIGRFSYSQSETTSTYGVLCEGTADSAAFAAVLGYLCRKINVESVCVQGSRNDQPYYWNIVQLDGVYYHVDALACALADSESLQFLLDSDLYGYEWAREEYPVCNGVAVDAKNG